MSTRARYFGIQHVMAFSITVFGIIHGSVALSDQIIDQFEATPFPWTTVFGSPTPTVSQNSTVFVSGNSSLELTVSNFSNDGFGVGTSREFSPALDGSNFTSISYWLRSSSNDVVRTVAIQLIDGNGTTITQQSDERLNLASVLNTWVEVTLPLDLVNGFEGPSNFDISNITTVAIILFRNSGSTTDARTIFVDDIIFTGDQPSKTIVNGLIDDFSPSSQYNASNLNDIGGFTDDDGTMGVGNTNDRVNTDGILSLTWNNDSDFWFTVFNDNGADISQNTHIQLRMRRAGSEAVTAVLRNSGNFTNEIVIPIPLTPAELTTLNLALNGFTPPPILDSMKSFTLTFPGTSSGNVEIDQIVLSPHRRPNVIAVEALTSTTFENGQTIQLQISLQDENEDLLDDYTDSIFLEVTDGAIDPASINGFDANGGAITADFRVSATTGPQTITIQDSSVNVSHQLAISLSPPVNQEVDRFDVEVPGEPIQFWGTFFPITITARNSEGLPVGDGVGQIDIVSDTGELVLFDNGDEVSSVNMTENPTTVQAYLRNPVDESLATVTLTTELISDRTKTGQGTVSLKNAVSNEGELEFFISQQDAATGLVKTVFNPSAPDDTAHVYTNALAVILFVHKAVLAEDPDDSFLSRAENILTTFQGLQIEGGANDGGFFDSYDPNSGTPIAATTDVTSGNNAWLLMAINYYTVYANDTNFLGMAVDLGNFLRNRQLSTDQPGTAFNDIGGIFSREGDTQTFVTEHQAEAFSALFYLSQIEGVSAPDAASFAASAEAVRLFMMNVLFEGGRFDVAAGRAENTALDAQTSAFLALPGPIVNDGTMDVDISSALDFVFTNIFKQQAYFDPDRIVDGPTFRELDPNPDCGAGQFVWIEGAGQLALALGVLVDSGSGSSDDSDNRDSLLENMRKVRDSSGGFPTHLGNQSDCVDLDMDGMEDETESVGSDEIGVVPAAWSYFNKVEPILNPYILDPVLAVKQDKVFIPGDGSSQVIITATLRRAGLVSGRNVQFDFEMGNGTLDSMAAPNTLARTTNTAGEAVVTYIAGDEPDIARVTVTTDDAETLVFGGSVSVLQDFVDNFEKGLEAGGVYSAFGKDFGSFDLEDGASESTLVHSGSFSGRLQTDSNGFGTSSSFIGVSKSFTVSSIDVDNANAVSYWVRGDNAANPPAVQIEFVMADDSVWTQAQSTRLTPTFQRIVASLGESDFARTAGSGAFEKSMIKSVNFLLRANSNDSGGTQRTLYIDDIVLFNNPRTLTVAQSAVFVPADGSTLVTVTATVLDNEMPPETEVGLLFTILNSTDAGGPVFTESGTATHSVTTIDGVASCTYRTGTSSAVAEISVEEQ